MSSGAEASARRAQLEPDPCLRVHGQALAALGTVRVALQAARETVRDLESLLGKLEELATSEHHGFFRPLAAAA